MAEPTQKPTMDGIRPSRPIDGVVVPSQPVRPQSQSRPQSQPVQAPVAPRPTEAPTAPVAAPITVPPKKKRRALRTLLVFLLSLLIIGAALAGLYWVYINFYA